MDVKENQLDIIAQGIKDVHSIAVDVLKDTVTDYKRRQTQLTCVICALVVIIVGVFIFYQISFSNIHKEHEKMILKMTTEFNERYVEFIDSFEFVYDEYAINASVDGENNSMDNSANVFPKTE